MAEVSPSRREYTILALLTLCAAIVRIVGLARESLWTDETYSAYATLLASPGAVVEFVQSDVHPPGFYLALWTWAKLFGNGEFALRLLPAIGGILMVPAVFRLGRQLFDVRTGLIAAFLAAFLIQSIYFSQELRAYSLMATLGTLSVSIAIDFQSYGRLRTMLLLIVATVGLAYMHYFGLLLAILIWTSLAIFPGRSGTRAMILIGASVFAFAFLPWVPSALAQGGHVNWIPAPDLRYVTELFNVYYGPGLYIDVWVAAFLAAGIPLALGKGTLRFKSPENLLLLWILVPLLVALSISSLVRPVYSPRNLLIGAGAAIMLLARAVVEIGERLKSTWIPAACLVIGMFAIHFATGRGYFIRPTKQQVREASQFVLERNLGKLPVFVIGWDRINFEYYFYRAGRRGELQTVGEADVDKSGLAETVPEREFWILSAGIDVNGFEDIRRQFEVLESGEFLLARAYHLRRKQP